MSSSEQGNRPGAVPPRGTGAATSAASAAAAAAATRSAPVSTGGAYGAPTRDGGPGVAANHSASSEASGGQWASAAPAAAPAAPTRPPASRPAAPSAGAMYGAAPAAGGGPRSVRLTLAGFDPWSVLKLSFLLSVAVGIAMVVSSVVLWSVLDGMGVFDQINRVALDITGTEGKFTIYKYVGLGRVISLSTVLAVVNVVLMTALSTLGSFLYNLGAGLVGGLHVTLTDD